LFISDILSADLFNGVSNPMNSREAQLQAKVKEQAQELSRLRQENALLRQKVDLLSRRIFGCSSEKLSPAQLELLLGLAQSQEQTKTETDEPEPVVVLPRARKERSSRNWARSFLGIRWVSLASGKIWDRFKAKFR
jgi:hypothetical protein